MNFENCSENDLFNNIPIGTNFIFKNNYLFDDETEILKEVYSDYRYVYKGYRYNRELLFDITYYYEYTWLPEDRNFKSTTISCKDFLTCIQLKLFFPKGLITKNILNNIKNYRNYKKDKLFLKSICIQKNIPEDIELYILKIMGYFCRLK